MDEVVFEKSCAVCFQTRDPIRNYIPRGSFPGSGLVNVSWPLGKLRIYRDYIEIYGPTFRNERLSDDLAILKKAFSGSGKFMEVSKILNSNILYIYRKRGVVVLVHKNPSLPKHILIGSFSASILYSQIKNFVTKNNINLTFQRAPKAEGAAFLKEIIISIARTLFLVVWMFLAICFIILLLVFITR